MNKTWVNLGMVLSVASPSSEICVSCKSRLVKFGKLPQTRVGGRRRKIQPVKRRELFKDRQVVIGGTAFAQIDLNHLPLVAARLAAELFDAGFGGLLGRWSATDQDARQYNPQNR